MKVALLEDDDAQAELVIGWLQELGYDAERSNSCNQFIDNFHRTMPQFAVLDWELPDGTGLEVLNIIRKINNDIPVLFITQRDSEEDIVTALSKGADDYLAKPLRQKEFSARVQALTRRAQISAPPPIIELGAYKIDKQGQHIYRDGVKVELTQKDYDVALCLFENHGKALSREYLLKAAWGVNSSLDTRTVDVHVSRVRRALGINPENGFIIKTIYRFGYRLEKLN